MAGVPDRVGCVSQEHDKSLLQVFSQACFCFPGRTGAPEKYFNKSTFSELHMQEEPVLQFQKRFYFNQFSPESKEWISWPFSVKNAIQCQKSIKWMIYARGNCCRTGFKALATKFWQIVGLLSIHWGNAVHWNLLCDSFKLMQGTEKANLGWSSGCKGIVKQQLWDQ